jgi:hypothetical protein
LVALIVGEGRFATLFSTGGSKEVQAPVASETNAEDQTPKRDSLPHSSQQSAKEISELKSVQESAPQPASSLLKEPTEASNPEVSKTEPLAESTPAITPEPLPVTDFSVKCTDGEEHLPEPHASPDAPEGTYTLSMLVKPDGCWSTSYKPQQGFRFWAVKVSQPTLIWQPKYFYSTTMEIKPSDGRVEFDFSSMPNVGLKFRNNGKQPAVVTLLFYGQ